MSAHHVFREEKSFYWLKKSDFSRTMWYSFVVVHFSYGMAQVLFFTSCYM